MVMTLNERGKCFFALRVLKHVTNLMTFVFQKFSMPSNAIQHPYAKQHLADGDTSCQSLGGPWQVGRVLEAGGWHVSVLQTTMHCFEAWRGAGHHR